MELLRPMSEMIASARTDNGSIEDYDGQLPFNMNDIVVFYDALKNVDSIIEDESDVAKKVFEQEDKKQLEAEQRQNKGLLEMAGAAMIIVVGGALCGHQQEQLHRWWQQDMQHLEQQLQHLE